MHLIGEFGHYMLYIEKITHLICSFGDSEHKEV